MKRTRYIYRKRSETTSEAFASYGLNFEAMYDNKKECLAWIKRDKESKFIGATSKPVLIKITIEEIATT